MPGERSTVPSRPGGPLEHSPGTPWSGCARRSTTKAAVARRSATKAAGRPQGPFKIKNLLQKIKTCSSNPIKPNQGFINEKNSEFFSGHFDGKSLANHTKTAKKTPQKGSKKWRFLTRFRQRQFVNQSQIRKRQFRDSLPRLLREQVIRRLLLPSCRDGGTSSPTGKVRQIYFLEMVIHFRQFIRLLILWM